jgi:hypothetical protein
VNDNEPLSDNQAGDLLYAVLEMLGTAPGATVRADAALKAARRSIWLLQLGLLMASERGEDDVPGITPRNGP